MKKILGYLKPYTIILICVIILIFVQAIGNLKLPDYMADIVNIGIQYNGVEDVTPKVISESSLEFLKEFMEENDKQLIEENYTLILKGTNNQNELSKYPLLKERNIYVLKDESTKNKEVMGKLDKVFAITDKVAMDIILKMQVYFEQGDSDETATLDFNQISSFMPMILNSMTPDLLENTIETTKKMEDTMLNQVALTFTKAFYAEVGLDIPDIQSKYMFKIGTIMIIITLVIIISSILVGFAASKISAGVAKKLRKDVFEKVQSFSDKELDKISISSLITRTTNDVSQVQMVLFTIIRIVFFSLIMMIGAIIMVTSTAKTMLWVLVLGFFLILVLIGTMLAISMPKFKIFQSLIDKLNLISREALSGIMVIRAFGTQKHEEKRFDKANFELANVMFFVDKILAIMIPAVTIIMNLLTILIVWIGADKVAQSTLQVGNMMAASQYTIQVMISFLMIAMLFIMFPRALVSIKRIIEILNIEPSIKDPLNPKTFDKEKIGYVEFKDVCFRYEGASEDVLSGINFVAKPGETTAIIGATGSGKTTLVKLIERFYDVTSGEILVNGVNVKELTQYDLHNQIGYIPQKASILSGTIESNLKYGNEDATNELIEKCVEVAQAKAFIDEKENRLEEQISQSGTNISGGQKQRLSIARALIKNVPIYIFDDSFSALDFKTDLNVRTALKENFKNVTKIIVAQRVNTIMDAEQILVIEDGKIIGKGTHDELMENCNTYKEIAKSQLGNDQK